MLAATENHNNVSSAFINSLKESIKAIDMTDFIKKADTIYQESRKGLTLIEGKNYMLEKLIGVSGKFFVFEGLDLYTKETFKACIPMNLFEIGGN